MAWTHSSKKVLPSAGRASTSEVQACFENERDLLFRLALLITGDSKAAEESLVEARELASRSAAPFLERLRDWAKWITVKAAIEKCDHAISQCESSYDDCHCNHAEHLFEVTDAQIKRMGKLLLQIDPGSVITALDPLARAVLILRQTVKASILDCTLRLNVSSETVVAANCRALTWLRRIQERAFSDEDFPAAEKTP